MASIFGFLSLLAIIVPGYLAVSLLIQKESFAMKISLGYLFGSSLFTGVLFLLNLIFALKLNFTNSWLVYFVLTAGLLFLNIVNRIPFLPGPVWSLSRFEKFIGALVVWLMASAFLTSFWYPVSDWDAVTLFDYRAKVILTSGSVRDVLSEASFFDYPLLTTLLHFWAGLNGLWTAMPVYPLFTISFVSSAYLLIRRKTSHPLAILFPLILLSAPKIYEHTFISYTNLPYTVLVILGAAYIYEWQESKQNSYLWVGVVLSLFSFWARGFPFGLVNIFLIVTVLLKKLNSWKWWLAALSAVFIFTVLKFPGMAVFNVFKHLKWSVMEYYWPYPLIFLFSVIGLTRLQKPNWFWTALVLSYSVVLIVGTIYISIQNPAWYQVVDAIQRMAFFINLGILWQAADALIKLPAIFSQPTLHSVSVPLKSSGS